MVMELKPTKGTFSKIMFSGNVPLPTHNLLTHIPVAEDEERTPTSRLLLSCKWQLQCG